MSGRSRLPSPSRVLRYVREAMIDGADEATVLRCRQKPSRMRGKKPNVIVRWKVWARLRAEGYSYPAIAKRFNAHHTTVMLACRLMAKRRGPSTQSKPKRVVISHPQKIRRPKIVIPIRFAGYDPREQQIGCRGTTRAQREATEI